MLGLSDVYNKCLVYENVSFILSMVKLEDAKALLTCYSDKEIDYFVDDLGYHEYNLGTGV